MTVLPLFSVLILATNLHAFQLAPRLATQPAPPALQMAQAAEEAATKPECFDRAIECAEHYGRCSVDELKELAEELESFKGCFYEDVEANKVLCQKEEMDRLDIAKTLRLQAELKDHQDYLRKKNIFAKDVHDEHDMHEREDLLETMQKFGTD